MPDTPFTVQPRLTAISLGYRNTGLIQDQALPRVPTGGTQSYIWNRFTLADGLTIPDTRVGRTGRPRQYEPSSTEETSKTVDYGIDVPVPNADVQNARGQADANARAVADPEARAALISRDIVALDREVRVSAKIFGAGTYGAGNKVTLSGTSQWSDFTNSDPATAILEAMDLLMLRPNTMVLGQSVWTKLRRHPKIVSAVLGNAGTQGIASLEAVRELLELDRLLVGQSFLNTARPGQATTLSRVWGKHAAMYHLDPAGGPKDKMSFGWTAVWDDVTTGTIPDANMGVRGGVQVRCYESVDEQIATPDLGYLFTNAVA